MSTQPPAAPAQGYGKSIAAVAAGIATTGIVALADQYLPHPLPGEAVSLVQLVVTGLVVWLVPHDLWAKLGSN